MKKSHLMMFGLLLFIGCSQPVYETYTTYDPPSSVVGKSCISQCVTARSSCEQLEYKSCNQRNTDGITKFDACVKRGMLEQKLKTGGYNRCEFRSETCSLKNQVCKINYDSCYSQCGGKADSKKVCVDNCKN